MLVYAARPIRRKSPLFVQRQVSAIELTRLPHGILEGLGREESQRHRSSALLRQRLEGGDGAGPVLAAAVLLNRVKVVQMCQDAALRHPVFESC